MVRVSSVAALCVAHAALLAAVKVKVVMHSEQDDSKIEDEEGGAGSARPDTWGRRKRVEGGAATLLPFLRRHEGGARAPAPPDPPRSVEERTPAGGERARPPLHPNDMLFPLIYRQSHINSMFKFGENWYTWSTEKRTDGSRALNYYICSDEPKRCDDVGWERTDTVPKCAFEIDSVMPDDRACLNAFGVEPHSPAAGGALCDGADQMKVAEIVRSCGPRIRSLWRFVRVGRRPPAAAKPADVNSLVCEDEEECFLTIEYRIHHDRITFSLHEPTRGQTYKSVLKRDQAPEEATETRHEAHHEAHRARGPPAAAGHRARDEDAGATRRGRDDDAGATRRGRDDDAGATRRGREEDSVAVRRGRDEELPPRKFHVRVKSKPAAAEGKGVLKERNESGYARRTLKNKIKVRDDVSDDFSAEN